MCISTQHTVLHLLFRIWVRQMFVRTKSICRKFRNLGRIFFGSSLVPLIFVNCVLYKIYYTLFLRELLWVPWLMIPYIYGIYVKRDLPYSIHLNFVEKGKNLCFPLYRIFAIFFEFYSLILFFCDGLYAQYKK